MKYPEVLDTCGSFPPLADPDEAKEEPVARDDLHDDAYDPNEIYLGGAKDQQGHSTNIRAKIPDNWAGSIAEVVGSDDWPEYRTMTDFYRDAIYHRMRWASRHRNRQISPRAKTLIALAQADAAIAYAALIRETNENLVRGAERILANLVSDGNQLALREVIKELEVNLDKMSDPYRSELARLIETYERRGHGL